MTACLPLIVHYLLQLNSKPKKIINQLTLLLTYLLNYLLTPWSRVLLEKPVKKFPTFYGTRRYIIANHFHLPTNALNCIKLRRLKSTCINILTDN